MEPTPEISVIVVTCNRKELLALCLEALAPGRQLLHPSRYEVIVSDDGAREPAEELLQERFPWARYTPGPRRGPASNRNCGARLARAPFLAFTDDDCIPDPTWLSALLGERTQAPEVQVFEGRTRAEGPRRSMAEVAPINEGGGYLFSCNFAITRALYEEMGGMDERFSFATMEDTDFAYRLKQRGEESRFVPAASVLHPWRHVGGAQVYRQKELGHLLYLQLHPEERHFLRPRFFLHGLARELAYELPHLPLRYRGRGWWEELRLCAFLLRMAWRLSPLGGPLPSLQELSQSCER